MPPYFEFCTFGLFTELCCAICLNMLMTDTWSTPLFLSNLSSLKMVQVSDFVEQFFDALASLEETFVTD